MINFTKGMLAAAVALSFAGTAVAYDDTAYTPNTGINNTAHDLSEPKNGMNYDGGDTLNRICVYCHAPHNTYRLSAANGGGPGAGPQASDEFDYLPLWNHELTANANAYTMYQNGPGAPTIGSKASQAIEQNPLAPGGVSLLCLSCHDGSVAVNSYGNIDQLPRSVGTGGAFMGDQYLIGKFSNLGNHHPIGFNYDLVEAADTEIIPADTANFGGVAGTVRDHLSGPGNTQMECSTCHSVHNKGNSGETLLWRSDNYSNLCLTCHDKGTPQ